MLRCQGRMMTLAMGRLCSSQRHHHVHVLETEARQQRGIPSSGPIFCKSEGFWMSLDQFEELPGGDILQLKLIKVDGKFSSFMPLLARSIGLVAGGHGICLILHRGHPRTPRS